MAKRDIGLVELAINLQVEPKDFAHFLGIVASSSLVIERLVSMDEW
jgi:hypothetical protein